MKLNNHFLLLKRKIDIKTSSNDQPFMLSSHEIQAKPLLVVQKWLDFSKKYGMGYIFSNGNAGVYFNDSSKIILSSNNKNFEYIERRSSSNKNIGHIKSYSLTNYPTHLEKKVTLLKHFHEYLKQKLHQKDNKVQLKSSDKRISNNNMIYVKKWLRTRHAMLFRMSNRTVQVIFFDNTQIALSTQSRIVAYVDKNGMEKYYPLERVFDVPRPDLSKRMKYIKDILFYLFSKSKVPDNV